MEQAATSIQLCFEECVIESYNVYEMATKGNSSVIRLICLQFLRKIIFCRVCVVRSIVRSSSERRPRCLQFPVASLGSLRQIVRPP